MKKVIIGLTAIMLTLPAAMCSTADRQAFCKDRLAIAVSEMQPGDVETADNDFDTSATVADLRKHNEAVEKVCGLVPAPRRRG